MYCFLTYVCLQKHSLRLICLSSIAYVIFEQSYLWRELRRSVDTTSQTHSHLFGSTQESDIACQASSISHTRLARLKIKSEPVGDE